MAARAICSGRKVSFWLDQDGLGREPDGTEHDQGTADQRLAGLRAVV